MKLEFDDINNDMIPVKDIDFDMSYATQDLLEQLREARIALDISQKELGERVGLPQSNIARLESGKVNPRLSNVLEIARALDMDLKLVPRRALPVIQGALRANEMETGYRDATSRALHAITAFQDGLAQASTLNAALPESLHRTIAELQRCRFDHTQFQTLQDAIKPAQTVIARLQNNNASMNSTMRRIREAGKKLENLRNQIVHLSTSHVPEMKPAFTLEDEHGD